MMIFIVYIYLLESLLLKSDVEMIYFCRLISVLVCGVFSNFSRIN